MLLGGVQYQRPSMAEPFSGRGVDARTATPAEVLAVPPTRGKPSSGVTVPPRLLNIPPPSDGSVKRGGQRADIPEPERGFIR